MTPMTGTAHTVQITGSESSSLSGSFVGREMELGRLTAELQSVVLREGTPAGNRLQVVTGEAGIGKRQLLREFRDRCQRQGIDYFSSIFFERDEAGYAPFEPILRALLARVGLDSLLTPPADLGPERFAYAGVAVLRQREYNSR